MADTAIAVSVSMLLAAIVLVQPLFLNRVYPQWDFLGHIRWAGEFFAAMQDGWVVPRWAFASHGGLGDPTFLYYQPLFYYVTSFFALLGLPPERALLWSGWVALVFAGALVMTQLAHIGDRRGALVGLVLVVASPVLVVLYTQFAAFPWLFASPFCVLVILESIRPTPSSSRLGLWLAGVCLAHVLTGMMVIMMLGIARPFLFPPSRRTWRGHVAAGCGLLIGLALAGFYLVPAMTLQNLISPAAWLDGVYVDWHRGFTFPSFTLARYGWRWFSMQLALPSLTGAMVAFAFWATRKNAIGEPGISHALIIARRLAIVSLVGLLLSSELSYPAFAILSPLQKLQHGFRFVVPSHLAACLALALVIFADRPRAKTFRWPDVALATVLVVNLIFTLQFEYSLAKASKTTPTYASLIDGESGQAEYLPFTTGPDWKAYNASGGFRGECARMQVVCDTPSRRTASFAVSITSEHPVRIRLPLFAFPAWRLSVDDVDQALSIDRSTGLIEASLPSGRHAVTVRWTALPAEILGRWVSFAAVLLILVMAGLRRRHGGGGAQAGPLA